jgi:hypothetical protein
MSGYSAVIKIRNLEQKIDALGFRWGYPRHAGRSGHDFGDVVALMPKDDSLPIYSRDAELFVGTIEQLEVWLQGLEWAREYDRMLIGNSLVKRRERKEQDYRNCQLMSVLTNPESANLT